FKKIATLVLTCLFGTWFASATTILNGFAITTSAYSETANWETAVDTEFGASATVARFEDLKATFTTTEQIASLTNLLAGQAIGVTYGNSQLLQGWRGYFIVYHGSSVGGGFAVHDKIGDTSTGNQISLGSWPGERKIMAANVAPASAPVPETSTTLLGVLGSLCLLRRKRN
ncbi:MAG: hypothetical protein ACOVRB_04200, partial [Akkermansiaceae bacterium]